MSHHIQTIIVPVETAEFIRSQWPALLCLKHTHNLCLLPVDYQLIDARVLPVEDTVQEVTGFSLLTEGFRRLLGELSIGGLLAYIETDYFGGVGGQGALVLRYKQEIMPPTWNDVGAINDALKLLGVKRDDCLDEFDAFGLGQFRDNETILEVGQPNDRG